MRGEHAVFSSFQSKVAGPSPHARGTLSVETIAGEVGRSIPACAGNTTREAGVRQSRAVHPRMRGEHLLALPAGTTLNGPSPHARGTLHAPERERRTARSIPACAGNTAMAAQWGGERAVHPRMRGEHGAGVIDDLAVARSIPACAGNTGWTRLRRTASPVHPRMRGEHGVGGMKAELRDGPSPHARGTQDGAASTLQGLRSIPACAGNTLSAVAGRRTWAVHPRMRGEHQSIPSMERPWCGPSPHARGTLQPMPLRVTAERSIPACAGNTSSSLSSCRNTPVHPRMRGEHDHGYHMTKLDTGPSPHARGTPAGDPAQGRGRRSIPACAGNTAFRAT